MQLNRREFLAASGASLVAGCAGLPDQPAGAAPARELANWSAVKAQFELTPDYLHLSQFYIVSHPRPVRDAIEQYRRRLDANPFLTTERALFEDESEQLPRRVQEAAAAYVGGKPEEIALTDSTTQGLALIYNGLPLKPGDEILATAHDHYVHHECIRLKVRRAGVSTRRVTLYDDSTRPDADQMADRLRRAIRPRTRVVSLTWVHSSTGVKLPIRRLAAIVAEANLKRGGKDRITLVVDGVHGFGIEDENPAAMGCDFFAAGTHKWIFAPRGTGIVWGRAEQWARIIPTIPTFYDLRTYAANLDDAPAPASIAASVSPGGFKPYEHVWAMPAAFEFHQRIGRKRVAERIHALNAQCKEGLAAMPHVKLHTPRGSDFSAGIIAFEVAGLKPPEVVARLLEKKVIASTSPYKISYARLAPSLVNDEREVDSALAAVRALA